MKETYFTEERFNALINRWTVITFLIPLFIWLTVFFFNGQLSIARDGSYRLFDCLLGPLCLLLIRFARNMYSDSHGARKDGIVPDESGTDYYSINVIVPTLIWVIAVNAALAGYFRGFKSGLMTLLEPILYLLVAAFISRAYDSFVERVVEPLSKSRFKILRYLVGG